MVRYPVSQPSIGAAERERVDEVLRSGWLTQGRTVEEFERRFADYLNVKHAVACTSGTTALHLALLALGVGPGDEVLVPDLTYVATANAVAYTGAAPVLVDVDPETWNIDLEEAFQHLGPRTRAIMPVHLYGVPCDMDAVREFAAAANLLVIEDAAEALGGFWKFMACGSLGDAGAFSFYGNKVLTTGEGGMVVTNEDDVAARARLLRGQAQDPHRRYYHPEAGFNYRMTEVQAAIGLAQLGRLDAMLHHRSRLCELYLARLGDYGYASMSSCLHGFAPWLFTLQMMGAPRDAMAARLAEVGIETRPAFVPLHRLPMYARPDEEFRMASLVGDTGLSLPTYADLPLEAVAEICDVIVQNVGRSCLV